MIAEPKRKISLLRAAVAGAACTLVVGAFRQPPMSSSISFWLGFALGGALLFVAIAALLNFWRR